MAVGHDDILGDEEAGPDPFKVGVSAHLDSADAAECILDALAELLENLPFNRRWKEGSILDQDRWPCREHDDGFNANLLLGTQVRVSALFSYFFETLQARFCELALKRRRGRSGP